MKENDDPTLAVIQCPMCREPLYHVKKANNILECRNEKCGLAKVKVKIIYYGKKFATPSRKRGLE